MLVHSRFISTIDLTGPIIIIVHHVVPQFVLKIGFAVSTKYICREKTRRAI